MPLIVAPQAAGLAAVPYLTTAEYRAAPTDVDLTSLVPNGSQTQQDDMLATLIGRASAWMDGYVHYQLGATIDTEARRVRVHNDGYVRVPTRGVPILEVDSFSIGLIPSQLTPLTSAPDGWVEDNVICMPVVFGAATIAPRQLTAYSFGSRVYVQYTYVNGYPNTLLTATAAQGAMAISLRSALGVYAGTSLVIYDSGLTETVVVAPTYVSTTGPGPTSVPIVSGLLNPHLAGVSVSALPANVKQAAILATTAFIKVRGTGGLVLDEIRSGTPKESSGEQGGLEDLALAEMLLQRYVLPFYG